MKLQPSRAGFTLVELLVVIGVIAILIAMLLPSLQKARVQANVLACASNQRQVAMAIFNYAHDHDGALPHRTTGTGGRPWYHNDRMGRYLPVKSGTYEGTAWHCPLAPLDLGGTFNTNGNSSSSQFAMSNALIGAWNLDTQTWETANPPCRITSVRNDKMLLGDSDVQRYFGWYFWGWDYLNGKSDQLGNPWPVAQPAHANTVYLGTGEIRAHGGVVNVIGIDGHSEQIRQWGTAELITRFKRR
jgi:prepilin-type N-terminal cleavage/methylation domain-containing protein